jgi:hypothetical protein
MVTSSASPFAPQLLEILREFFLGRSRRGDQCLHFFTGGAKGLQVGLARLGFRRDVDANGRSVSGDGDRRLTG